MLFEAFRESLIEVENQGFPVVSPPATSGVRDPDHLPELLHTVNDCFGHYYGLDPLKLVVVGTRELQSAFSAATTHGTAIIARIEGDHTATSARDLGQIVWPVVKEAMSGIQDSAMREVSAFAARGQMASGLDAVIRMVNQGVRATLLVEDDYRVRGRIEGTAECPVVSPDLDVREVIDDAVDVVVERVLAFGGNVVFTPSGALSDRNRIVLLLHGAAMV